MKILFSSYAFSPSVGGIESVSEILAERFVASGHHVELVTETPAKGSEQFNYSVTRQPNFWKLFALLRWADVFFQNNISLRSLLPALLAGKPTVVAHQTWIRSASGHIGWSDRVKRMLLPRVANVAISQAIADDLPRSCPIIPNPYRDALFRTIPNVARDRSLVFLGRLVSEKGVDLLFRALRDLREDGITPDLTIIGTGPEEPNLRDLRDELKLGEQIVFAGAKSGTELAMLLNRHRVMVVPSRWAEPFGVVALEGIACGCAVIGSENGGLREAMGPCGIAFKNGDQQS